MKIPTVVYIFVVAFVVVVVLAFVRKHKKNYNLPPLVVKKINKGTFSQNKKEVELQHAFSKIGLAPRIYDFFSCENNMYIVMERLDTTFLHYITNNIGKFTLTSLTTFYTGILAEINVMINTAFTNGLVHGDLTHGNNIMFRLGPDGKTITSITFIDFGRSRSRTNNVKEMFSNGWLLEILVSAVLYYAFFNKLPRVTDNQCKTILQTNFNDVKPTPLDVEYHTRKVGHIIDAVCGPLDQMQISYIVGEYKSLGQLVSDVDVMIRMVRALYSVFGLQDTPEVFNNIMNVFKREPFGLIQDCKGGLNREKIDGIDYITDCDWTLGKKLGSGTYGTAYESSC